MIWLIVLYFVIMFLVGAWLVTDEEWNVIKEERRIAAEKGDQWGF